MANSTQYQKLVDKRLSGEHFLNVLSPSEQAGRLRVAVADITAPAAGTHTMLFLPAKARIISAEINHDDFGAGKSISEVGVLAYTEELSTENADGTVTHSSSAVVADPNLLHTASINTQNASTAPVPICLTKATKRGAVLTNHQGGVGVTITTAGAATANKTISLTIQYVVD